VLAERHELGVSAVNVAELYSGLPLGASPAMDEFVQALAYWDISWSAAARAGADRYSHARRGSQLSTTDVLIAAVARDQRAVLVTANIKDFPMTDVEVLALR
jgi:predicted nucleic acid-binding protein